MFIFQGCEDFIDAVGARVGYLRVEEAGVHGALGDSLLSSKGILAFESANVG
jgi:hypothetical protein